MRGSDLLRLSVENLGRRKVRTALTLIGVVIGVAALVLMVSLGIGLKVAVVRLFETDEMLRTMQVSRVGEREDGFSFFRMASKPLPVTEEDIGKFRAIPGVASVTPEPLLFVTLEVRGVKLPLVHVGGVLPEERATLERYLVHGRLWTDGNAHECVFPSAFFEFGKGRGLRPEEVLGETVRLSSRSPNHVDFTLVGVIDSDRMGLKGGRLQVPFEQALATHKIMEGGHSRFVYKEGEYPLCVVNAESRQGLPEVRAALERMGFRVDTAEEMIGKINTVFLVVEGVLACVGAIGLIVALFGIANTMGMSALERTREIGIMRALGARRSQIRRLFLLESGWIGLFGGAAGFLAGWGLGFVMNIVAHGAFEFSSNISLFRVSFWLAAGSIGFSVLVSVVAGVVPAHRAARFDPVRALRYEG